MSRSVCTSGFVTGTRTVVFFNATFIWTVVTLRFFFDRDTIGYVARNE